MKSMENEVDVQIIIQARMGSSRLPGKILKKLVSDFTILEWIIELAKCSRYAERIVVATTENPKDDETVSACMRRGCHYSRGSEEDVLKRFVDALYIFPCNIVLQINADSPFFDVGEMDRLVEIIKEKGLDYASNHQGGLPLGTGTEAFTSKSLFLVASKTDDFYDHEHVTPYFYNHPEIFKQSIMYPLNFHPFAKQARLALDTSEDLEFLRQIVKQMNISSPDSQPSTNEILSFLEKHPYLLEINKNVIQKTFPSRDYKNIK